MGKLWKTSVLFIFVLFLFCGCKEKPSQTSVAVVTGVEIEYTHNGQALRRYYSTTDKMDTVLFYLYSLSPYGNPASDPEELNMDSCRIALTLSDGQKRIYRQRGDSFLSIDCHRWEKIDPKKGEQLLPLLQSLSSDI